ncbi:phospholipase D family protein [Bdellovibrio svalbardensis]|uniref:Phospholipase D family protein n=1 Tax=Bdellovibrio svalbardensis TaxID=2972972 RepID=A0ABT6DD68_9BACT|nr:phospholipase D family protein [Bdellovibrio svalbardensis]MDG0814796.1 phospholipase D family protein [Bdellovibrio svalbardensis]
MSRYLVLSILATLVACKSLPKNITREPSVAFAPDPNTQFGKLLNPKLKEHPGQSALYPLSSGQDALIARIGSAQGAEHSLDLQYYIWMNDLTGNFLLSYVLAAADRGVRVRILLDDLNQGKYEKGLAVIALHPNVEIRMVNPFAHRSWRFLEASRFSEVNKRMHNKVFIADNQVAIVGGRNIGNEYFWASDETNFGDFDLWVAGPVVADLSSEFDSYWNSTIAYPISALVPGFQPQPEDLSLLREKASAAILELQGTEYAKALRNTEFLKKFNMGKISLYWGIAHAVFDPPAKLEGHDKQNLQHQLLPFLQEATTEVILVSPYFIPGKNGIEFFKQQQNRGVRSIVLTNSLASSDVSSVFGGYKGYRKDLLKSGVELYELKARPSSSMKTAKSLGSGSSRAGLHGKTFVFDRKTLFVGSMNLDPRSIHLNSEMGVIVDSPELLRDFVAQFQEILREDAYKLKLSPQEDLVWESLEDGKIIEYFQEPETGWWKRFKTGFISIFVPESQL